MKRPLIVGDRVAVYCGERIVGVVSQIFFSGNVSINTGAPFKRGPFHQRQCRRLVKKKSLRRVWARIPDYGAGSCKVFFDQKEAESLCPGSAEIVEFIEVRRKKS